MSSLLAEAAAESGMQEATLDSGTTSPAHAALPKLPSWSASGWQTLLKQPSAGTANLTDMLADLGQSGEGAQASGDASASPLFKWTSDGSMMEELMKAYKDSSPGTPTFGGGAPGNSLLRDGSLPKEGSLYKDSSLYKDGSITSCLQAAFQAQLEEEDQQQQHQAIGLASVLESPRHAAGDQAAKHQQAPQPFAFVPMSADNHDSPQLHMPAPLEIQRMTHPPSQLVGSQVHPEYTQPTQPGTVRGQSHQAQQQQTPQLQQQQPQLQRRLPHLQPPIEGPPAAAPQLQPTWPDQLQYQFVNESVQQLPRQLPEQQSQQQHHLGSIPVTANVISHPPRAQYDYAQPPPASQLLPPQGNQGLYPAVPAAVITSGAMGGPNMWGRAEGRSGSPALQPQGPSPGAGQASHLLHQADGSIQAVPRIIIRTSAPADPPAAPMAQRHSPPSQQAGCPVVLNSRVVREPTPDPPTRADPYAHWAAPQRQQHHQQYPQAQQGMHQHKAEQQSQSGAHAQQTQGGTQAYVQQAPSAQAPQVQQHHQPASGQLQYAPQQLPQQLPGQLPQQGHHHLPRPGSFQELLSAPILPEQYSGPSAPHDPASSQHSTAAASHSIAQRAQPAQPVAAVYASQVLHQPPASAADSHTAQTGNPGMATIATTQHMPLVQQHHAGQHQRQQQQQSLGASPYAMADRPFPAPLHMQTSSAMYPPIQYPQAVGAFPLLPKLSTDHPVGSEHPYHAYHGSQAAAGSVTQSQQLQQQLIHHQQPQQQQQQQQQFFQYAQQHHHARLPLQHTLHSQQPGGQVSNLTNPLTLHQAAAAAAAANAGSASPAQHQGASVQVGSMTYNPPPQMHDQPANPSSLAAAVYQAVNPRGEQGSLYHMSHAGSFPGSFHDSSHQSDRTRQQPSHASTQHGQSGRNPPVTNPQDIYYSSQRGVEAATKGSGGVRLGSVRGVVSGPPHAPMGQAGGPSPGGSADGSANQQELSGASSHEPVSSAASTAAQSSLQEPHGTVLLTSHPVAPSQLKATGKVVSFVAASDPPHQQDDFVMPSIPSLAKENVQEQSRQHGPPPQPGRKFKRDRSSRKNSFSFPPVPPKKHASAGTEFSPASSVEFALHGAASAPVPSAQPAPDFSSLAVNGMPHSASCQDVAADAITSAAAACTASGGKSSRSSSADVIFCAEGIDFNSRAWKNMSRKEKNRASAAASRARREAYTESLEDMVRKLQEERDWLQEQIDPGSVEKLDSDSPMQLPRKPPVRHMSL